MSSFIYSAVIFTAFVIHCTYTSDGPTHFLYLYTHLQPLFNHYTLLIALLILWLYTAGRPPLSQPPKPLMAIRLSSDFSHLRPGVFHISLRTHKTQHSQPRGMEEKRTNKQTLTWVSSKTRREKFVTLLHSFLCICELSQVCILANFTQSHLGTLIHPLTLFNPASGSTDPSSQLPPTSVDCSLLLTAPFCRLPCSVLCLLFFYETLPSLVFFRSCGK